MPWEGNTRGQGAIVSQALARHAARSVEGQTGRPSDWQPCLRKAEEAPAGPSAGELGWTVAAVDGDAGLIALYSSLAQKAGAARFWSLNRGDQALERLASDPPDVLLMELILPRLDGLALLEKLAETGALRHTRVMVISSSLRLLDLKPCLLKLGVTEILTKPFEPFRLVTHLMSQRLAFEAAFERARKHLEEAKRLGMEPTSDHNLMRGMPSPAGGPNPRRSAELPFVQM